ncbi:MAG: alpha/beta hydrolase fold domain-containing protein [Pirellulaceae bacterium]
MSAVLKIIYLSLCFSFLLPGQSCFAQQLKTLNDALTATCPVKCITNQRYSDAEGKAGLCDVYLPDAKTKGDEVTKRPAVVIVHGGAWMTGDKWTLENYSRLLASHGFVVVTINYRLAPEHKFPRQVDDVRQALIWTAEHADEYSIDLDRLGLFGYSAGGHLSILVAMLADEPASVQQKTSQWSDSDPRWKAVPKVHAICAGGPPCDFRDLPIDNTGLAYFLGGSRRQKPETYDVASPIVHASPGDPPLQIIHGAADFMVPIASSQSLYKKLKAAGNDVRYKTLAGQGHMMAFLDPTTRQTMLEFFQSVFVKPTLSVWDMRRLGKAPAVTWLEKSKPIGELIYQGEEMNGEPTDVFAFYATPGSIVGNPLLDKNLPAVVLVHGGGGTAFDQWVWLWAQRGYAAIAMDLSGRRPEPPRFDNDGLIVLHKTKRERLDNGGPEQGHAEKFESVGGTLDDDWSFHAIGNVIRAHSLIRSFAEVDAERTAITGISWGGYTTCIAASVDDRFKAGVPVYGCGFLHDGQSVQRSQIEALTPEKQSLWIKQFDPSSHLARCRVPMFFVNGTNDKHYPLRSYSRSYALVPWEKQIRIEPMMKHSHQAGWAPKEIGLFIDSKLKGGKPLPKLGELCRTDSEFKVDYTSDVKLKSAQLHYTTDDGPLLQRKWQSESAWIDESSVAVNVDVPIATVVFFTVTDQRDAMVSTDVLWMKDSESAP